MMTLIMFRHFFLISLIYLRMPVNVPVIVDDFFY